MPLLLDMDSDSDSNEDDTTTVDWALDNEPVPSHIVEDPDFNRDTRMKEAEAAIRRGVRQHKANTISRIYN